MNAPVDRHVHGSALENSMATKNKTQKAILKELKTELRYWQMIARLDVRSLRASRMKCRQIGELMRAAQKTRGGK